MKCPFCNEFKGNSKVRGYPVKEQLRIHILNRHKNTPASDKHNDSNEVSGCLGYTLPEQGFRSPRSGHD